MERYTITIPEELLHQFDTSIEKKGYANRSEAIRDLIRDSLVHDEWVEDDEKVAATVTLIYDHHTSDLGDKLTDLQHHQAHLVVAATHVHLDNDNCLEVIILRGSCKEVRHLAEKMIAIRGVKHGKIVHTTEGRSID